MRIISSCSRLPVRTIVLGAAIPALLGGTAGLTARAHRAAVAFHERGVSTADHAVSPDLTVSAQVKERYGHLPLSFEANHGQTDSKVKFLSRGGGYSLFLTSTEAVLVLSQSEAHESREAARVARTAVGATQRKSAVVRMTLVNANPQSKVSGHDELPGKSHYLTGNDPATWRTNISTYAQVKYEGVYPGVDLVYYGNHGRLEYDFVVAPGADPGLVTLAFEGTRDVHIDARGDLVLRVEGGGEVRQHKPVVYQEWAGIKQEVAGRYVTKGTRQVGFQVAAYDPSRPLIIDPVLVYSTYLGGGTLVGFTTAQSSNGVAVDGAGSAYVIGITDSTDFPTTAGAVRTTPAGGSDAFVAKLDAMGSGLVYSTYLGGSGLDFGNGIAVDGAGSAYVTGTTESSDFPTTAGAFQTTLTGFGDAFVTKLDATGSALVYSTYLGGSANPMGGGELIRGSSIAVDGAGSAYVIGLTGSSDFPTTAGAFQTTLAGLSDAFVTKLNATGSGLVYSTYLGGTGLDQGEDIAVDGAGSAYVTGSTQSTSFPTTAGAVQTTAGGFTDAFVTKVDATGSGLVYSTYLGGGANPVGGGANDFGSGIAVDGAGSAYVTGVTDSTDFPTTVGAFQTTLAGRFPDAFVTKLDAAGFRLVYSTYLGGNGSDHGFDIAVDGAGSGYVTGTTESSDFPTTAGAFQTTLAADESFFSDAFVTKLDATGSGLVFSTYLGGGGNDAGGGVAVDGAGSAYVKGVTEPGFTGSTDFPTTAGAFQTTPAGGGATDAFVAKIEFAVSLPTARDAIADSYVRAGGWAFTNFGASPKLLVKLGLTPDFTRRGYVKFDISDVQTIGQATLRLHGRVSDARNRQVRAGVFRVGNQSWDEQTVTWSTKPAYGPLLGIVTVRGTAPQWVEIDLTAFVQAEQQAGRHIISVALRALEHTSAYAEFQSREAGDTGPRLVITR